MSQAVKNQPDTTQESGAILQKLLWSSQARWQLVGAFIGGCLGLLLVLGALQLYFDVEALLTGGEERSEQFVQINKKVNIFNTLGASSRFTPEEVDSIAQQPFVEAVGPFTSNDFKVGASSPTLGFYTELFFEAIPEPFLDFPTSNFGWAPGQKELPIVLARDYLALYNFGFAPSQGLPQFNQNTIRRASFVINVQGRGRRQSFDGRIVGFSDRINSILVPQAFMDWANENFGAGEKIGSSRLMLQVDNPLSETFRDFVSKGGYELSSGRLVGGQFTYLVRLLTGLIFFIGCMIVLLAALVFIVNFRLLIAKSEKEIQLLLQLGYLPIQIRQVFQGAVLRLYGGMLLLSLLLLVLAHWGLALWLIGQGYPIATLPHWLVLLIGIVLTVFIYFLTIRSLDRTIQEQS